MSWRSSFNYLFLTRSCHTKESQNRCTPIHSINSWWLSLYSQVSSLLLNYPVSQHMEFRLRIRHIRFFGPGQGSNFVDLPPNGAWAESRVTPLGLLHADEKSSYIGTSVFRESHASDRPSAERTVFVPQLARNERGFESGMVTQHRSAPAQSRL